MVSPEASSDLAALHAYISQESSVNAARMIDRILAAVETLKLFPHRTVFQHRTPRLVYPVRTLPVKPYVIYFRVIEAEKLVRILTIRHGARRRLRRFD